MLAKAGSHFLLTVLFVLLNAVPSSLTANESAPAEKAAHIPEPDPDAEISVLDYRRNSSDVLLPEFLWNKFEAFVEEGATPEDVSKNHSQSKDSKSQINASASTDKKTMQSEMFFPRVIVSLPAERKVSEKVKIRFSEGGGTIDLKRLAPRLKGNLNILIEFPPALKEYKHKIYFLSKYKREIRNGKTFGSGCSTALDITSFFEKNMGRNGFELTLDNHEYLAIYGGSYFLVAKGPNSMYLARVTLTDSRYSDLSCDPK